VAVKGKRFAGMVGNLSPSHEISTMSIQNNKNERYLSSDHNIQTSNRAGLESWDSRGSRPNETTMPSYLSTNCKIWKVTFFNKDGIVGFNNNTKQGQTKSKKQRNFL
jgi:hypothetical protein